MSRPLTSEENMKNMPGYTAEASIYKSTGSYWAGRTSPGLFLNLASAAAFPLSDFISPRQLTPWQEIITRSRWYFYIDSACFNTCMEPHNSTIRGTCRAAAASGRENYTSCVNRLTREAESNCNSRCLRIGLRY